MRFTTPSVYKNFPFDIIKMSGDESVGFLQRISTNDFSLFQKDTFVKTLILSDKGRVIDTIWARHCGEYIQLLCSKGMSIEIIEWLTKYIIMEEIELEDSSAKHTTDLYFNENGKGETDYFGVSCSILIDHDLQSGFERLSGHNFEFYRIRNGIPVSKKEINGDYNPLELNLWDWISFTKGCYIGQEVIARLDTYQKIQRSLCFLTAIGTLIEGERVCNESMEEIGKITSVLTDGSGTSFGLAMIKKKAIDAKGTLITGESNTLISIDKVFEKK